MRYLNEIVTCKQALLFLPASLLFLNDKIASEFQQKKINRNSHVLLLSYRMCNALIQRY